MSETTVEVQGIELGSGVESERSRERSRTRNSWAVGSAGEGSGKDGRRKSIKLLGIDSANLAGAPLSSTIALVYNSMLCRSCYLNLCYIAASFTGATLSTGTFPLLLIFCN
jgi:hypothetical protein